MFANVCPQSETKEESARAYEPSSHINIVLDAFYRERVSIGEDERKSLQSTILIEVIDH